MNKRSKYDASSRQKPFFPFFYTGGGGERGGRECQMGFRFGFMATGIGGPKVPIWDRIVLGRAKWKGCRGGEEGVKAQKASFRPISMPSINKCWYMIRNCYYIVLGENSSQRGCVKLALMAEVSQSLVEISTSGYHKKKLRDESYQL